MIGDAALVLGGTTHSLEAPLRVLTYRNLTRRYSWEAIEFARLTHALDGEAFEIDALVSFEADPVALVDLLEDAADTGDTIEYLPSQSDPSISYDVILMNEEVGVTRDRLMGDGFRRWETMLTLRGVGTDLSGLVLAARVLVLNGDHYAFSVGGSPDAYFVDNGDHAAIDAAVSSGLTIQNTPRGVAIDG